MSPVFHTVLAKSVNAVTRFWPIKKLFSNKRFALKILTLAMRGKRYASARRIFSSE